MIKVMRKRPTFAAAKFDGTNLQEIQDAIPGYDPRIVRTLQDTHLEIPAENGTRHALIGSWIVYDERLRVLTDAQFRKQYDAA